MTLKLHFLTIRLFHDMLYFSELQGMNQNQEEGKNIFFSENSFQDQYKNAFCIRAVVTFYWH